MERINDRERDVGDERAGVAEVRVSQTQTVVDDDDTTVIHEEIREEIRETRERLGDTLEEIGSRLNPTHLKNQATREIREATIGRVEHMAHRTADRVSETGRGIMDTIRDNPLPAAMVGVGLGWLIWNGRGDASRSASRRPESSRGNPYTGASYGGYAGGSAWRQDANRHGTSFDSADTAEGGMLGAMRARAGEIGDRAQQTASDVADRVQDAAGTVADQTRREARRVEDFFHENPLAVGAATLALGAMVGLAVPETGKERELMGEARERLVDRVKDAAENAGERVQHVAQRVADDAKDSAKSAARDEGLTA